MPFRFRIPIALCVLALTFAQEALGGSDRVQTSFVREDADMPRFEFAEESAYMLGVFGNPHAYEYATEFLSARMRWGTIQSDNWMHGYHQVYFTLLGGEFIRGLENHYFGINTGFRYNFLQPGRRLNFYMSGGVGLGDVDATKVKTRGALGQNFTFNIVSAFGVSYTLNNHWKLTGGILYQHLSNAGLSEPERPNSSLNLLGPQFGATYSF